VWCSNILKLAHLCLQVVGLYKKDKVLELLDKNVVLPHRESELELYSKLKHCIEVALHCVQEPEERPTMSTIVEMLRNTTSPIELLRHSTLDSMVTAWSRDHNTDLSIHATFDHLVARNSSRLGQGTGSRVAGRHPREQGSTSGIHI
jgi:hypothetical protein